MSWKIKWRYPSALLLISMVYLSILMVNYKLRLLDTGISLKYESLRETELMLMEKQIENSFFYTAVAFNISLVMFLMILIYKWFIQKEED